MRLSSFRESKCSCGGVVEQQEPTPQEDEEQGCGTHWCCSDALQCNKCGTRFSLGIEAPEMEDCE